MNIGVVGSVCAIIVAAEVGLCAEWTTDVVIYGSSPAAIAAAVQVRRMGISCVVVSPERRIGGLTTGGLGQTDIGQKDAFGGLAREFYKDIRSYYSKPESWKWQRPSDYRPNGQCFDSANSETMWTFEPSAALKILESWEEKEILDIRRNERLVRSAEGVRKTENRIVSIQTESGNVYHGRIFIDATYEGDLMAEAGVRYAVGRESCSVYGETIAGYQPDLAWDHRLHDGVDPYVIPGHPESGLLPGIEPFDSTIRPGSGDERIQAYCYRMCLTDVPENRIPFTKPDDYDERDYELLFRNCEQGADLLGRNQGDMPNRKTDTNNHGGFSTDMIGVNYNWAEASYEERERIAVRQLTYQKGLMWTLANHSRVPKSVRDWWSRWGTCRDEFIGERGGGWQNQIYVREARRLLGEYIMTERNCRGAIVAPDPVCLAAYGMDSHHVQRRVTVHGFVQNEGNVEDSRGVNGRRLQPYPISYRALVPHRDQCDNLLVPVCLSASHVAFGSIRMEPVFFSTGQAAGAAAAIAIFDDCPIQEVDYAKLRQRLISDGQVLEWRNGPQTPADWVDPYLSASGVRDSSPDAAHPDGLIKAGPYSCGGISLEPIKVGTLKQYAGWGEEAYPGRFRTVQAGKFLRIESTVAKNAALYRFDYGHEANQGGIVLRIDCLRVVPEERVVYARVASTTNLPSMFAAIEFDTDWKSCGMSYVDGGAVWRFDFILREYSQVRMRIGFSSVSAQIALAHAKDEIVGFDFERTALLVKGAWDSALSISSPGKTPEELVRSYSAEYRRIVDKDVSADRTMGNARWVDPFVGTAGTGHTTPVACVPFGMVQAGADTGYGGWSHCSGYVYDEKTIHGFTQTHLNGTGCPDLGDVCIVPMRKRAEDLKMLTGCPYDKGSEIATPGYYAVTLSDPAVRVEVSASSHSSIYRMTAKEDCELRLLIELRSMFRDSLELEKNVCEEGAFGVYRSKGWVDRTVGYAVVFDRKAQVQSENVLAFTLKKEEALMVKIGLSAKDSSKAKANLKAEIPGWDLDAVKNAARQKWNEVLGAAVIEGTDEQKKNWYTSLYHLCVQPNNIADCGGKPFYSTFSCWDTFRAAGPMYTILYPEKAAEFVDSMLEQGKRTGYLPIWTLWGKENQCMIGTHSVPMIVDWFLKEREEGKGKREKGRGDVYWENAYAQIKETLTKKHEGRIKENWDLYDQYGYYPFDKIRGESVSRTMECAYDDWCAGVMAEKLGHTEDAAFFFKRAAYWKNVFDPSIGLVRGKDTKGNWREPFDPYALGHGANLANDFTEGNAFQYSWHVMQDPQGLVAAMGGREKFAAKLDSLFNQPQKVEGMGEVLDVTGLIGQYVHGNEPSHHIIYFYPQIGQPEKAAERIREVFDKFYLPKPDGLCGNDDCGQMSAWYLFSAMGFYPFNPCGGEYVIGAPQVSKAILRLASGKTFTIIAKSLSKENKYVKSVALNGKPIEDRTIRHEELVDGGELVFEMTSQR